MSTATPSRPAEPAHRRARRLASRFVGGLTTPLVGADYLDYIAPLRHGGELRARIVSVTRHTPDAVTLVLRPGRDWAGHTPGQHARVGIEVDGVRLWRTYSITSAPMRGDQPGARLEITVKAVPDGVVSGHLTQHAGPGDLVFLGEADGDFTVPEAADRLLFIAGGSGITPVIAMLRAGATELRDVVVVSSARTEQDAIFGDELRDLARAGRITLFERHTATQSRFTGPELLELIPDAHTREAFACGPAGLVQEVEQTWHAAGLFDRLHAETFHTPLVITGDGGTAEFSSSGVTVTTEPGQSLLDAGEAAGLLLPSGCRQGLCFRCVRPLISGTVQDLRTGELTHAEAGDDGVSIQTCISTAAGSCLIDG